jgi:hypothetical protein
MLQTGTVMVGTFLGGHPFFTSFTLMGLQFAFMYMYYTAQVGPKFKSRHIKTRHALHDGIYPPKNVNGERTTEETTPGEPQPEQGEEKHTEQKESTDTTKTNKKKRCICCNLRTDWWGKAYRQQTEKRTEFPELKKLKKLREQRLENLKAYEKDDLTDAQKDELEELSHRLDPALKKRQEKRVKAIEKKALQEKIETLETRASLKTLEMEELNKDLTELQTNGVSYNAPPFGTSMGVARNEDEPEPEPVFGEVDKFLQGDEIHQTVDNQRVDAYNQEQAEKQTDGSMAGPQNAGELELEPVPPSPTYPEPGHEVLSRDDEMSKKLGKLEEQKMVETGKEKLLLLTNVKKIKLEKRKKLAELEQQMHKDKKELDKRTKENNELQDLKQEIARQECQQIEIRESTKVGAVQLH